ncbi:hypothetical protein D3C84_1261680 [compost metagenome]
MVAVELVGGGEVQADLVTGLNAVGIRATGADVKDHVQYILRAQGLFDPGDVGGPGVGRRGREYIHRHVLGFGSAGATCKR